MTAAIIPIRPSLLVQMLAEVGVHTDQRDWLLDATGCLDPSDARIAGAMDRTEAAPDLDRLGRGILDVLREAARQRARAAVVFALCHDAAPAEFYDFGAIAVEHQVRKFLDAFTSNWGDRWQLYGLIQGPIVNGSADEIAALIAAISEAGRA
jgi:hypothetical protein